MKKLILLLSYISGIGFANAQSWQIVGSAGFSAHAAYYNSIVIDSSGAPYVAYADGVNTGKATVMKYNGSSWTMVGGAAVSAGAAFGTSLAIDRNGTPYVVYGDAGNNFEGPATVRKYNGSSWVTVGNAAFSDTTANYTSIAIDRNGTPYVVYQDGDFGGATVMKYNGSSWVTVGSAGFSAGEANITFIAIDSAGTPYVTYIDIANGSKTTVMKYNGSNWVTVGNAGFSTEPAISTSIAIDGSGAPYVLYQEDNSGISGPITAMKYDGSSWVTVGNAGFSDGVAEHATISIDSSGTPYVAYHDANEINGIYGRATAMKYNGSNWVTVGTAGFSASTVDWITIALDRNGTPYVAFMDVSDSDKATVMKYSTATGVQEITSDNSFSIYPNPTTNQLTIHTTSFSSEAVMVSVMNVLGQVVSTPLNVRSLSEVEVDVSALSTGVYFVQLKSESGSAAKIFVKE